MASILTYPRFFSTCASHPTSSIRFFCIDCDEGCCGEGASDDHASHAVIQILRASGCDAARLQDLRAMNERLSMPLDEVQKYRINGGTVVFLSRSPPRVVAPKPTGSRCRICCRLLLPDRGATFCSLTCWGAQPLHVLASVAASESRREDLEERRQPRRKHRRRLVCE